MSSLKQVFKKNTHNALFKALAGFGRSMHRLYENRNHDIVSNGELNIINKLVKIQPKNIIDAGANIGDYTMLAAQKLPYCCVYGFEPVEETYQKLAKRVAGLSNVYLMNKALYSSTGRKAMHIYPSSTHSSLMDINGLDYTPNESREIDVVKGDDFLSENHINKVDLLKIDTEGSEMEVLLGFDQSIQNKIIRAVQFEYGYINISTKVLLMDFYRFFEERNFIIGKIFPKKVEFREYQFKYEDFMGPNYIAVRKDDKELIELLSK